MKKLKLTKDLMEKLRVRPETIKFISDYGLINYSFDKLDEIEGDYHGYIRELKSYNNIKVAINKVTYDCYNSFLSSVMVIENHFKNNRLIKAVKIIKKNGLRETRQYNENGNLTLYKKSNGYWKRFTFNEKGVLTRIADSEDKIEYWDFNNNGQVIYHYYYGKWEKYTYDEQGREIFYETNNNYFRKSVWKGNELTVENSRGQIDKYIYDKNGNVILYTDVINDSTMEYTYDEYGNETFIYIKSKSHNRGQRNKYDDKGNKVYHIDSNGREEYYTYNDNSQLLSYKDNRGGSELYVYNKDGILIEKNINGSKTEYLMQTGYFIVKKNNKITLKVPLKNIIK